MPIFRFHRGSLKASMETCVNVTNSLELLDVINTEFKQWLNSDIVNLHMGFPINKLLIDYYCFDERINWDTYIVTIPIILGVIGTKHPVGFLNGIFDDWKPGEKEYFIFG